MFRENLTKFKRGESPLYTNPKPFTALATGDIIATLSQDTSRVSSHALSCDILFANPRLKLRQLLIIHYFILILKLVVAL
jgi:hypothetical protein